MLPALPRAEGAPGEAHAQSRRQAQLAAYILAVLHTRGEAVCADDAGVLRELGAAVASCGAPPALCGLLGRVWVLVAAGLEPGTRAALCAPLLSALGAPGEASAAVALAVWTALYADATLAPAFGGLAGAVLGAAANQSGCARLIVHAASMASGEQRAAALKSVSAHIYAAASSGLDEGVSGETAAWLDALCALLSLRTAPGLLQRRALRSRVEALLLRTDSAVRSAAARAVALMLVPQTSAPASGAQVSHGRGNGAVPLSSAASPSSWSLSSGRAASVDGGSAGVASALVRLWKRLRSVSSGADAACGAGSVLAVLASDMPRSFCAEVIRSLGEELNYSEAETLLSFVPAELVRSTMSALSQSSDAVLNAVDRLQTEQIATGPVLDDDAVVALLSRGFRSRDAACRTAHGLAANARAAGAPRVLRVAQLAFAKLKTDVALALAGSPVSHADATDCAAALVSLLGYAVSHLSADGDLSSTSNTPNECTTGEGMETARQSPPVSPSERRQIASGSSGYDSLFHSEELLAAVRSLLSDTPKTAFPAVRHLLGGTCAEPLEVDCLLLCRPTPRLLAAQWRIVPALLAGRPVRVSSYSLARLVGATRSSADWGAPDEAVAAGCSAIVCGGASTDTADGRAAIAGAASLLGRMWPRLAPAVRRHHASQWSLFAGSARSAPSVLEAVAAVLRAAPAGMLAEESSERTVMQRIVLSGLSGGTAAAAARALGDLVRVCACGSLGAGVHEHVVESALGDGPGRAGAVLALGHVTSSSVLLSGSDGAREDRVRVAAGLLSSLARDPRSASVRAAAVEALCVLFLRCGRHASAPVLEDACVLIWQVCLTLPMDGVNSGSVDYSPLLDASDNHSMLKGAADLLRTVVGLVGPEMRGIADADGAAAASYLPVACDCLCDALLQIGHNGLASSSVMRALRDTLVMSGRVRLPYLASRAAQQCIHACAADAADALRWLAHCASPLAALGGDAVGAVCGVLEAPAVQADLLSQLLSAAVDSGALPTLLSAAVRPTAAGNAAVSDLPACETKQVARSDRMPKRDAQLSESGAALSGGSAEVLPAPKGLTEGGVVRLFDALAVCVRSISNCTVLGECARAALSVVAGEAGVLAKASAVRLAGAVCLADVSVASETYLAELVALFSTATGYYAPGDAAVDIERRPDEEMLVAAEGLGAAMDVLAALPPGAPLAQSARFASLVRTRTAAALRPADDRRPVATRSLGLYCRLRVLSGVCRLLLASRADLLGQSDYLHSPAAMDALLRVPAADGVWAAPLVAVCRGMARASRTVPSSVCAQLLRVPPCDESALAVAEVCAGSELAPQAEAYVDAAAGAVSCAALGAALRHMPAAYAAEVLAARLGAHVLGGEALDVSPLVVCAVGRSEVLAGLKPLVLAAAVRSIQTKSLDGIAHGALLAALWADASARDLLLACDSASVLSALDEVLCTRPDVDVGAAALPALRDLLSRSGADARPAVRFWLRAVPCLPSVLPLLLPVLDASAGDAALRRDVLRAAEDVPVAVAAPLRALLSRLVA